MHSAWFGFSRFDLPPTYVLWDRAAMLQHTAAVPAGQPEVAALILRQQGGKLVLTATTPLVRVLPVPEADAKKMQ